jgi:hypothetical protein
MFKLNVFKKNKGKDKKEQKADKHFQKAEKSGQKAYSEEEEKLIKKRLRDLGYIE